MQTGEQEDDAQGQGEHRDVTNQSEGSSPPPVEKVLIPNSLPAREGSFRETTSSPYAEEPRPGRNIARATPSTRQPHFADDSLEPRPYPAPPSTANSSRQQSLPSPGAPSQRSRLSSVSSYLSYGPGSRQGLTDLRKSRRQAEQDYQTMKARISKLAMEEERARKTAELSKRRAQEVAQLRAQVASRQREREREQEERQSSLSERTQQHAAQARVAKNTVRMKREALVLQRQEAARQVKEQREAHEREKVKISAEAVEQNRSLKSKVARRNFAAEEERGRLFVERQRRADEWYKERMVREQQETEAKARDIAALAKKEKELLQRLARAQAEQAASIDMLQEALI